MHYLPLLFASVFSAQVFAVSVHPRGFAPPGWESFYCFEDNRIFGWPLFTGAGYADPAGMTIEKCAHFCESQSVPYRFMGLTAGFQCSCDNFFEYIYESDEPCNKPCPGNPSEVGGCGGMDDYMPLASTYHNVSFRFPTTVPSVGLWNGLGCYTDSVSARALQVRVDAGSTTVESCVAACQARGFSLAGVEYGKECWCGSQLENDSRFYYYANGNEFESVPPFHRQDPNQQFCIMGCQGNPTEACGGPSLLNLYNFTGTYPIGASVVPAAGGWTSQGCYSDSVSSRTLERSVNAGNVTVESCVSACQSQSFTMAGLEYAQECWCGNKINSPGAPISQSACNQACIGDKMEVCGGPDALQLYHD